MTDLEKEILRTAKGAVADAIVSALTGYNRPLSNITNSVIEENYAELFSLVNSEFSALLKSENFRGELKEALNKKLARTLIERMGGELEKQVNKLKSDPSTRARITLAIEEAVKANAN